MEAVNDAAFFEMANNFRGFTAGCHEVLRRRRLLQGSWYIDPDEDLNPSHTAERGDDTFIAANLERWLS